MSSMRYYGRSVSEMIFRIFSRVQHLVLCCYLSQVADTPQEIPFLNILQHLLSIEPKDAISDIVWDTAETLVHRATLLENREDSTRLLRTPSVQKFSCPHCRIDITSPNRKLSLPHNLTSVTLTTPQSHSGAIPVAPPLPSNVPTAPPLPPAGKIFQFPSLNWFKRSIFIQRRSLPHLPWYPTAKFPTRPRVRQLPTFSTPPSKLPDQKLQMKLPQIHWSHCRNRRRQHRARRWKPSTGTRFRRTRWWERTTFGRSLPTITRTVRWPRWTGTRWKDCSASKLRRVRRSSDGTRAPTQSIVERGKIMRWVVRRCTFLNFTYPNCHRSHCLMANEVWMSTSSSNNSAVQTRKSHKWFGRASTMKSELRNYVAYWKFYLNSMNWKCWRISRATRVAWGMPRNFCCSFWKCLSKLSVWEVSEFHVSHLKPGFMTFLKGLSRIKLFESCSAT